LFGFVWLGTYFVSAVTAICFSLDVVAHNGQTNLLQREVPYGLLQPISASLIFVGIALILRIAFVPLATLYAFPIEGLQC